MAPDRKDSFESVLIPTTEAGLPSNNLPSSGPGSKITKSLVTAELEAQPLKLEYIDGLPILSKMAGTRSEPKQLPQRTRPVAELPKLEYRDGFPNLSRIQEEASATPFKPVSFRDYTPGKCLQCSFAGTLCPFEKKRSFGRCGRCERHGKICLVRRPGGIENTSTGADPGNWIAANRGIEDSEAIELAREMMREYKEGGRRYFCGMMVDESDFKGWAFPAVKRESGKTGVGFREQILPRKPAGSG